MKSRLLFLTAIFLAFSSPAQAQETPIVFPNIRFTTSWQGSTPSDSVWIATCGSPRDLQLTMLTTQDIAGAGSIASGIFFCNASASTQETTHMLLGPAMWAGPSFLLSYNMWPGFYWSCQLTLETMQGSCLIYATNGTQIGTLQLIHQP